MSWSSRDVTRGCPAEIELSLGLSLGPTAALSAHLAACARCARLWRTLERPRALARALPARAPEPRALEQVRTGLLAAFALEGPPRRRAPARRALAIAAPLLVAAAAILAWRLAPRGEQREAARAGGAASPRAAPAPAPRGARIRDERRADVGAASPAAERPAPEAHRTVVRTKVAAGRYEAPVRPTAAETAFVKGWSAFREARFDAAAAAFGEAVRLEPEGALAEDGRYWRAVSLARAGAPAAADELSAFVRRHPRSAHAGDASSWLARLRPSAPSPTEP